MWLMIVKKLLTRKKRGPRKGAFLFVVGPVVALFSLLLIFFLASDFWVYIQLLFFQRDAQTAIREPYRPQGAYTSTPGGSLKNPLGDDYGDVTVNMAGVDIHIAGYIKEWLEIARDVCNRKLMHPEVSYVKTKDNGNPTIALVLGTMITEGNLPSTFLPHTGLVPELYQPRCVTKDSSGNIKNISYRGDYNFYRYDSVSGKTNDPYAPANTDKLKFYRVYWDWQETTFYSTPFQMDYGWAKYYPNFTWPRDSKYRQYPAAVNGKHMGDYTMDKKGIRVRGEADAAYVPDMIASSVQWYVAQHWVGNYYDASDLTMEQLAVGGWPGYNAGLGSTRSEVMAWGKGGASSPDGQSKAKLLCSSYVKLHEIGMKVGRYYVDHDLVLNFNSPDMYRDYEQMWIVAGGGFFLSTSEYNDFVKNVRSNPEHWIDAYRAGKNNSSATIQQMLNDAPNWIRTLDSRLYPGRGDQEGLFWFDDYVKVNYGGGAVPALHGVGAFDAVRGVFTITMGAPYAYWMLLNTAGVVCTRKQAFDDCFGDTKLVDLIDTSCTSGIGVRIATIAANYALPSGYDNDKYGGSIAWDQTRDDNTRVAGTGIYRYLVQTVKPEAPSYGSCDANVCTAVRAAGADDSYITATVTEQLDDLVKKVAVSDSKWEEIFWYDATTKKFDIGVLQPGDVFIFSSSWESVHAGGTKDKDGTGHTFIYCGEEIINNSFGDAVHYPGSCVHASVNDYAPAVCGMSKTGIVRLQTGASRVERPYRVFRCINPEEDSKYAGKYEEAVAKYGITHMPPENWVDVKK